MIEKPYCPSCDTSAACHAANECLDGNMPKTTAGPSAVPELPVVAWYPRSGATKLASPPAKYRDPKSGQSWTGRGLKPLWLVNALDRGAKLADFEVKGH